MDCRLQNRYIDDGGSVRIPTREILYCTNFQTTQVDTVTAVSRKKLRAHLRYPLLQQRVTDTGMLLPNENRSSGRSRRRRCLWREESTTTSADDLTNHQSNDSNNNITEEEETFESIRRQFVYRPVHRTFRSICSTSVVVVQEFALTSFLLARHRLVAWMEKDGLQRRHAMEYTEKRELQQQQWYMDASTCVLYGALVLTVVYSAVARGDRDNERHFSNAAIHGMPAQDRRTKAIQRSFDAALLAVLLRFSAAVLQSLTASYSSDTVQTLSFIGMLIHLIFCDYSYANGRDSTFAKSQVDGDSARLQMPTSFWTSARPPFQGGTVSLNAAFFATTLLVSRLRSGQSVYAFVSLSVVLFSFYPSTRHTISAKFPSSHHGTFICQNSVRVADCVRVALCVL